MLSSLLPFINWPFFGPDFQSNIYSVEKLEKYRKEKSYILVFRCFSIYIPV